MQTVGIGNAETPVSMEQITQATSGPQQSVIGNETTTTQIAQIQLRQEIMRRFMLEMVNGDHRTRANYKKKIGGPDICVIEQHIRSMQPETDAVEQEKLLSFLESVRTGFCKRMDVKVAMERNMSS